MNNNNFDDSTILDQGVENKKETNTEKAGATEKRDASWKKVIIGSSVGYVLGTGTSILTASAMLRGVEEAPLSDEEQTAGYTPLFDSEITMATSVNDDMSFAEAFDAAREELGPGGVFVWHGNIYSTYTPEEWDNMSPEEQADFAGHFSWSLDPIDDSADDEVITEEDEVVAEEEPVVEEIPVEQAAPVHEAAPQVVYTAQTSVVNDGGIPVATSVSDDMSFSEAFAAAREEVGPGGAFEWHGSVYHTYRDTDSEWNNMSQSERLEFSNQAIAAVHHQDSDNHYAQNTGGHTDSYDHAEPVVVETAGDSDVDVVVLGVEHDYESGMNFGTVAIDGEEFILADVTGDGTFNLAAVDLNGDGYIQDNEVQDISGAGITVNDLGGIDNPVFYAANMDSGVDPDYTNDADVSDYSMA